MSKYLLLLLLLALSIVDAAKRGHDCGSHAIKHNQKVNVVPESGSERRNIAN